MIKWIKKRIEGWMIMKKNMIKEKNINNESRSV